MQGEILIQDMSTLVALFEIVLGSRYGGPVVLKIAIWVARLRVFGLASLAKHVFVFNLFMYLVTYVPMYFGVFIFLFRV